MPATYLSPGVYVEEVPSGSAPIAGVGTSTAGFIGVITSSSLGASANTRDLLVGDRTTPVDIGKGDGTKLKFELPLSTVTVSTGTTVEVSTEAGSAGFFSGGRERTAFDLTNEGGKPFVAFKTAPAANDAVTGFFKLRVTTPATATSAPVTALVAAEQVKLCTNFSEFKNSFGDFSSDAGQNILAHAVYGFFRNGGTRCYVAWVTGEDKVRNALEQFEAIDEIAIVAAPGITTKSVLSDIDAHCKNAGDRVAIFDSPETVTDLSTLKPGEGTMPGSSDYAALYFPWIKVFDPVSKAEKAIPPSGHMAGIYARVDTQRGVHKAPANETILGAIGLKYNLSRAKQDGLNPQGINCIRSLNGNIRVWGARTLGGDGNGEFKYINIRRLFNFLRESLDEGTQWTVFEPNAPDLWAAIRRNVTAFLTIVWRSGALFGNTPEQAFYVKCDEETNPPEIRDQGQVVTEIGVAVVKPAEFVVFRISQWAGPGGS
jgi:uncharacterized protein